MLRRLIASFQFTPNVLQQLTADLNANFAMLEARLMSVSASTTVTFPNLRVVYIVNTTAGNVTLTLPAASDCARKTLVVKKIVAANTLTLDADGAETIDGAATLNLTTQWATRSLYCDGSAWYIVAN